MESTTTKPPAVYAAIAAVMAELSREGITKDRKNVQQGFAFRGIDDVFNALNPILSRHQLVMLPRMLTRTCEERTNKAGTSALFYTVVQAEFDLVAATDGSKHTIATFGEAMDSGDKSTNKAMAAAYKYAAFQAFCIPTEADNDADATTHEPAPRANSAKAPTKPSAPAGDPVAPTIPMATDDQKMDISAFLLDERTRAKAEEAIAYYEKEHGVNRTTLAGLTQKMADVLIKKCEALTKPADAPAPAAPADAGKKGGKK